MKNNLHLLALQSIRRGLHLTCVVLVVVVSAYSRNVLAIDAYDGQDSTFDCVEPTTYPTSGDVLGFERDPRQRLCSRRLRG